MVESRALALNKYAPHCKSMRKGALLESSNAREGTIVEIRQGLNFSDAERFCAIHHVKHCCNRFSPRSKTILTIPGSCRGTKEEAQGEEIEVQRLVIDRIIDRLK
jgi:hypothetical protein